MTTPSVTVEDMLAARDARAARQRALAAEYGVGSEAARRDDVGADRRDDDHDRHDGHGADSARALVSVTLVVPGPDKNPPWAARVFDAAMTTVRGAAVAPPRVGPDAASRDVTGDATGGVVVEETHDLATGPQGYVVLACDPHEVKARLVEAEETHPWGRLFDLDVVVDGVPLQRADVGAPARRCLVCDGPAAPCSRSRAHHLPTLYAAIEEVLA